MGVDELASPPDERLLASDLGSVELVAGREHWSAALVWCRRAMAAGSADQAVSAFT